MRKCFVPGCRSGYKESGKGKHFFRPPKNEEELSKWVRAINRKDKDLAHNCFVCDSHFSDELLTKADLFIIYGKKVEMPRKRWALKPGAVPHLFPNLSEYLPKVIRKRKSSVKRLQKKNCAKEDFNPDNVRPEEDFNPENVKPEEDFNPENIKTEEDIKVEEEEMAEEEFRMKEDIKIEEDIEVEEGLRLNEEYLKLEEDVKPEVAMSTGVSFVTEKFRKEFVPDAVAITTLKRTLNCKKLEVMRLRNKLRIANAEISVLQKQLSEDRREKKLLLKKLKKQRATHI